MALFLWGPIVILFGVIWLGTLLIFISSRYYSSKVVRWAGVIPFAGVMACAIWILASSYYISMPSSVFKTSFGFAPTNDVRELKSKYWYFGDTGLTYLKFKANPQTIKRIVALGLIKESVSQSGNSENYVLPDSHIPEWWTPDSKPTTRVYSKTNRIRDFASEEEMLCYDEGTQQAYYSFQGID